MNEALRLVRACRELGACRVTVGPRGIDVAFSQPYVSEGEQEERKQAAEREAKAALEDDLFRSAG